MRSGCGIRNDARADRLWSGLCFTCLTLNNVLVTLDVLVLPARTLFAVRNEAALVGMLLLLYGLIFEAD